MNRMDSDGEGRRTPFHVLSILFILSILSVDETAKNKANPLAADEG